MNQKPTLKYRQIWNLNFGFLGLQVCLSLITANTSRILSGLGADTDELAFLWLMAPISGLIIQPIVGHFSDKTWSRFGRRIPYIFIGAIITALLMLFMPNSQLLSKYIPSVFAGVGILFLMQSALNGAMQPYRSLVGDMVNEKQSNLGFSVQTLLTNIGAIIGSLLPFILTLSGIGNKLEGDGNIVSSVAWSFYAGALLLLFTNFWTCFNTKEYSPKQLAEYNVSETDTPQDTAVDRKKLWTTILQLSIVQFFSWFAFYYLWVYTTDGIAQTIWNTNDPYTTSYNDAANWFGVLTGLYSIVAAVFSIYIPRMADRISRKRLYAAALLLGGISMLSLYYIQNQFLLLIPMIGVGLAWAMILTIPYAILSSIVPPKKMGLYMGLFNITIVMPQIVAGVFGKLLFDTFMGTAIGMIFISGISLILAAISVSFIKERN